MTALATDVVDTEQVSSLHRTGTFLRLLRKPLGAASLIVLIVLVLLGVFGSFLTSHAPNYADLAHINAPPGTPGWPLGGDQNGRDLWSRSLASINVSVVSALIGAGVGVVIGSLFGLIAGYVGGRTDSIVSWIFNLLMTFPSLVLVIVLAPITGGSYQAMMVIFGFFLAPGIFRLVRNLVFGVRNELYVDAARVAGLSNRRILSRHVLYVVRGPVIIAAAFLASAAIGVQAGLAFLGVGSTQVPSFGAMTNAAFTNMYAHPEQLIWSAGFLALLNGSLVLLGNAYRDILASPQDGLKSRRARRADRAIQAAKVDALPKESQTARNALPTSVRSDLLSVRNLWVRYPAADGSSTAVVRGLSLDVEPGEIVGLVGESGSGKTQTAFSILGLLPKEAVVSADVLTIAGESLAHNKNEMRKLRDGVISYVPQEPMSNLDPSFTVGSQLVEGLTSSMSRKEATSAVLQLLERVGIDDPVRTFKSYPHQISGGMAQRVLIAGAVATRPKLLIADEPTTALDVTIQAEILDLLRDLQGEFGMGVLLVTHNFGVVADLCDRVLVMQAGEIVESGDVRAIFNHAEHPYTQELLGSILDEDTMRTDTPAMVMANVKESK